MRVTFVRTKSGIGADGALLLSTLLKQEGHSVNTVFLPRHGSYEKREYETMHEMLASSDLVMISVYSTYVMRAVHLTEYVHENIPGIMVIWGGPHCFNAPELSLRHADGVCFGEADEILIPLVNALESDGDFLNAPNMAFKIDGAIQVNEVIPPLDDLDSLPYPSWEAEDLYILNHSLSKLSPRDLMIWGMDSSVPGPVYDLLSSRGCPHNCSYCFISQMNAVYGHYPIRFRSVDHFIGELEYVLGKFDFYRYIGFVDDDFFMRPRKDLEYFAEQYSNKIGLPFWAQTSSTVFQEDKLQILIDAGLKTLQMGIQSGSQRVLNDIYSREIPVGLTREVVQQIGKYVRQNDLRVLLHFILDQPYENKDDIIDSYKLMIDIPPEMEIDLFVAAFFPGTDLYNRLVQDNYIQPFNTETFRDFWSGELMFQTNYETMLVKAARSKEVRKMPRFILQALGSRPIRKLASLIPESLYANINRHYPGMRFRLAGVKRRIHSMGKPLRSAQPRTVR